MLAVFSAHRPGGEGLWLRLPQSPQQPPPPTTLRVATARGLCLSCGSSRAGPVPSPVSPGRPGSPRTTRRVPGMHRVSLIHGTDPSRRHTKPPSPLWLPHPPPVHSQGSFLKPNTLKPNCLRRTQVMATKIRAQNQIHFSPLSPPKPPWKWPGFQEVSGKEAREGREESEAKRGGPLAREERRRSLCSAHSLSAARPAAWGLGHEKGDTNKNQVEKEASETWS